MRVLGLPAVLVSLTAWTLLPGVSVASVDSCPNAAYRTGPSVSLPDCRAYEQVSPVAKNQADALGGTGYVQGSPAGDGVTYYSDPPFPSVPGASDVPGGGEFVSYLAQRDGAGWMTQGLLPQSDPGTQPVTLGSTEDLSRTFLYAKEPLLAAGAVPGRYNRYIRHNDTGSYSWVVGPGETEFVDATPEGSKILFEDSGSVLPGVADEGEAPFLYLWDESEPLGQQVSFVGVVEGGAPPGGTVAGAGPPTLFYEQNVISDDGSRVFFTDRESERVYVREPVAGRTVAVSAGQGVWRASTPDGHYAFYTEGEALYRFDVDSETRLTLAGSEAGVLGTVGISDNGDYAYFVATASLAAGAIAGEFNLYAWHAGVVTFVATVGVPGEAGENSTADWRNSADLGPSYFKSSRVTPDGTKVLFSARLPVTGYDSAGQVEYYLYDAQRPSSADNPVCVSCNPSGSPATSGATIGRVSASAAPTFPDIFPTRTLSADGDRVFFETSEALLAQDTNGVLDVYEWERGGTGSCPGGSGSCTYLISTGRSPEESFFGDASAEGGDVFFFTVQPLVGQDQDENRDVYDARVLGGLPAQNPPAPAAACGGEACRATPGSPPELGLPVSAGLGGAGNLVAPRPRGAASPPRSLTRAQRLARALRVCRHKTRRRRHACETRARKQFGHIDGRRHS